MHSVLRSRHRLPYLSQISDGRAVEYIGITSDSLDVRYHLQMVHRGEKVRSTYVVPPGVLGFFGT